VAINLSIKNIPPYLKIIFSVVPSLILVVLFVFLIYSPKNNEIKSLNSSIVKLDNEIASSEVKVRKLNELKAENARLKARLVELQEQLPEEEEVSNLLKQITDMGLKSGLEILLWRPEVRKPDTGGVYMEIPVKVTVTGGYHDLGVFFSHISHIKRIVNISDIKMVDHPTKQGIQLVKADFTASTFSAMTEAEKSPPPKKKIKR
jgi:type IV pilus assembly protein PilO